MGCGAVGSLGRGILTGKMQEPSGPYEAYLLLSSSYLDSWLIAAPQLGWKRVKSHLYLIKQEALAIAKAQG